MKSFGKRCPTDGANPFAAIPPQVGVLIDEFLVMRNLLAHYSDYGRTLGVVFVDGKNVNLEMIKAGLAEVYRGPAAKGLDLEPYRQAEAEAKKNGIGMWSLGDKYVSPKEWRRMQR